LFDRLDSGTPDRGNAPACCPADLNLDVEIGMSDLTLLLPKLIHGVPFEL
jgi:hypothetical protein